MKILTRLSAFLSNLLLWIGGAALVLMMLLACANMLLRGVWVPVKGTYELMGFFGALTAAFALGHTQMRKGHIALTVLAGKFPKRVERFIDAFSYLVCAVFFALVARQTCLWAYSLIKTGELSETLEFAYYPFPFAEALSALVLALVLLTDGLNALFGTGEKK